MHYEVATTGRKHAASKCGSAQILLIDYSRYTRRGAYLGPLEERCTSSLQREARPLNDAHASTCTSEKCRFQAPFD